MCSDWEEYKMSNSYFELCFLVVCLTFTINSFLNDYIWALALIILGGLIILFVFIIFIVKILIVILVSQVPCTLKITCSCSSHR